MRHRIDGYKLGRLTQHRWALFRNLLVGLFRHERIETTEAKAKAVRGLADHVVTLAKRETLHARRQVLSLVPDREVVGRIFDTIAARFADRQGGYTRLIKTGVRHGDAAPMVLLELVDRPEAPTDGDKKGEKKEKAPKAEKGQAGAGGVKFAPGEHVRIVPLHYPKPSVSIDELGRLRGEAPETDLFDGQPHVAAATAHLTYNNGPLLTSVQVFTIFWGTRWNSPSGGKIMQHMNKFFQAILVSPLLKQLHEYSVPGKSIEHGSFIGTKVINAKAPVGSVTDSGVRKQLKAWIAAKTVPKNTKNTLYFIYLDPGVISIMGGSKSCQNYCGYHDAVGSVYYAVMPYPTCAGCL